MVDFSDSRKYTGVVHVQVVPCLWQDFTTVLLAPWTAMLSRSSSTGVKYMPVA
jgi:hypothetical protein